MANYETRITTKIREAVAHIKDMANEHVSPIVEKDFLQRIGSDGKIRSGVGMSAMKEFKDKYSLDERVLVAIALRNNLAIRRKPIYEWIRLPPFRYRLRPSRSGSGHFPLAMVLAPQVARPRWPRFMRKAYIIGFMPGIAPFRIYGRKPKFR